MTSPKPLPEFVLFGDSLTEWSFKERTQGFGLFLERSYADTVKIVNQGYAGFTSTLLKDEFDQIIERATSPHAAPTLLMTIFLGANDACSCGDSEYVPWAIFEANIRAFVETILTQDNMPDTKIVLITPPPIGIPVPSLATDHTPEMIEDTNEYKREGPGFKTYMSKKRYAEGIMRIASDYEETGRVVGLNFWKEVMDGFLREGNGSEGSQSIVYDEDMPPGCGLVGAPPFSTGWFTDGLHLNTKGYNVLSKSLMEVITAKWPGLAPDKLMTRNFEENA